MSYCRWSSEDWSCDLYVYEDVHGGWTSHVAGNRPVFAEPLPAPVNFPEVTSEENPEQFEREARAWVAREKEVMDMLDDATRKPIDHPDAGSTFNDPTPGACADRLEKWRSEGLNVPQYAIDRLRAEESGI